MNKSKIPSTKIYATTKDDNSFFTIENISHYAIEGGYWLQYFEVDKPDYFKSLGVYATLSEAQTIMNKEMTKL